MDIIKIGLDFGTHQTKICIKTYPNEDKRHPIFEFFKFKDSHQRDTYFLPSEVQINENDTLSYGYIDTSRKKKKDISCSPQKVNNLKSDIYRKATELYNKYATTNSSTEDITVLVTMLSAYQGKKKDISCSPQKGNNLNSDIYRKATELYNKYATANNSTEDITVLVTMLSAYQKKKNQIEIFPQESFIENNTLNEDENYFKYFKQATFSEREWHHKISCEKISIWYLSYIIFLLEERYGTDFSINIGIPVGEKSFKKMKEYATQILLSAYHLVEDIYKNNLKDFLNETIDVLLEKTKIIPYTQDLKKDYNINIFPEAFAGLCTLTSAGKLSNGMSLIVDIGGGTTDISFFTINGKKPLIFRYWSIPKGLNYIAEASGFNYEKEILSKKAKEEIIEKFFDEENKIISELITDLLKQLRQETIVPKSNLINALENRIIVYNGGGSTEKRLVKPIFYFKDVILMDANMWKETDMLNKEEIIPLCQLLTTAYGLSLCETDQEVTVSEFTKLFKGLGPTPDEKEEIEYIDKDKC